MRGRLDRRFTRGVDEPPNNDRNPFDRPWYEIEAVDVENFLTATTDDEPLHWEAKGTQVRPEQVATATAGFANREGGYLIIGASRDLASGSWQLDGVEFTHSEPGTWISSAIRSHAKPPPHFDVRAWTLPSGTKAAVVQVQPNTGFLSMVNSKVPYRGPGETYWVEDGAQLQSVQAAVQVRSRALPGGSAPPQAHAAQRATPTPDVELSADLDPGVFLAVAKQLMRRGETGATRIFLSEATNAARSAIGNADEDALGAALDRIVDCAAVATSYAPDGGVAHTSIEPSRRCSMPAGASAIAPAGSTAPALPQRSSRGPGPSAPWPSGWSNGRWPVPSSCTAWMRRLRAARCGSARATCRPAGPAFTTPATVRWRMAACPSGRPPLTSCVWRRCVRTIAPTSTRSSRASASSTL